jgi:hypothetical protein
VVERGDCYSRPCTAWSGVGGTRCFLAGNGNGVYSGGKRHKRLRGADGGEARVERLCSPGKAPWVAEGDTEVVLVTQSHVSARSCATRALGERCDAAKTDAWRCDWPRWTGGVSALRLGRGWKWAREEEQTRLRVCNQGCDSLS